MDSDLAGCIQKLGLQNDILGFAREVFLMKEAERKSFEARLVREAMGKSHAEKLINAQATEAWTDFNLKLARLEAAYEFEKLKYSILDKNWQSTYLSLKIDSETMRRG